MEFAIPSSYQSRRMQCAADVGVSLLVRKVGGVDVDAERQPACKSGEGEMRN
jgi:hypothetical protein